MAVSWKGIKITDYCDQETVSTRDRLDLFMKLVNVATGQEMLNIPPGAGMFQSAFNRDGTILAAGTYRIEGTNEAYNVLLLRAPSLADIATQEGGNPAARR